MEEIQEVVQTLKSVEELLDELVVRGLRAVDARTLARLRSMEEEFKRIGAAHLAEAIGTLASQVEADDPSGAASLLRAQTSVRLFERVMSREYARHALAVICGEMDESDEGDEGEEE